MAGSRRKRSPEKDDPSKRRRTGEQAQSTNETTPQDPTTTSPDTTTNLEQTQTRSPTKQKTDDAVAGFMAKWEQMAPVRTQATSVPENSGDPKDSRLPQKTVRFVKGTGSASEVATNGDQDLIDDQLSRESGTPGTSELHGNGDGPYIEPTLTDEGTPGGGGGAPGGGGDETGGTTDPLPTTRLPQGDFKPHPILPRTDDEFEEVLILIKRTAWRWAFQHFNNVQTNEARRLDLYKLSQESPELMEYANWIALGGNRWEDIFNDKRASLVFGILGKMLEVHVFGHEMFGATSGQLEALLATEKEMAHVDGFARQQVRASTIRGLMANSIVPPNFDAQAQSITLSFYTMIRPLIPEPPAITTAPTSPLLDPTTHSPIIPTTLRTHINNFTTRPTATRSFSFNTITPRPSFPDEHTDLLTSLYQIISSAAKTSLNMRREPATIYHISSPPKNSPFALETSPVSSFTATSDEMHCMNLRHLRRAYQFVDDTASALVTMVCFPGIVAYRPGNGREGGEDDGYRTRRICTAEVVVGWANRAEPVRRRRGDPPLEAGAVAVARNWTWGPGDWDVSLREAVEARRKAGGISTPLLVAGGMAGVAGVAGVAAVAGYMQAQAMNMM